MAPPRVAALVLNWNGKADTLRCLDALAKQRGVDLRVLVLDNGSTDGSVDALASPAQAHAWRLANWRLDRASDAATPPSDWVLVHHGINDRYATGNNHMLRLARRWWPEHHLLVLNNDVVLPVDGVARLAKALLEPGPGAELRGAVAPTIRTPAGVVLSRGMQESFLRGGLRNRHRGETEGARGRVEVSSLEGACLLVRHEVMDLVGGFDPGYFLYWEDADWCRRCRALGFTLWVVQDVDVVHGVSSSSGGGGNPATGYCIAANRWRFLRLHWPIGKRAAFTLWYVLVWLPGTLAVLLAQGQAQLAGATLRGAWHGLRHGGDPRIEVALRRRPIHVPVAGE